jgi:transcriptional regulator with XRE-family HTH domain
MLNTERLKNLRKEANYKQSDVAGILGVGRTTYAKYESGDIQPPNDQVIKIATLFKISSDYLLNLSNDPTPQNKKAPPKPEPDIKWGDFGISFHEGRKKLTQTQKDKIAKLVQIAVMNDDEYYWGDEENKKAEE